MRGLSRRARHVCCYARETQALDTHALDRFLAGVETGPSMEFLKFLGEWEAGEGEWVDPAEVQSADWPVMSNDSPDASGKGTGNAE